MGKRFRIVDRDTPYMFPPSVQDWLPENHLARFVVGVVEKLDFGGTEGIVLWQGIGCVPSVDDG